MEIMKVKELQDRFSAMNPDDDVWVAYITKDDIEEVFSNVEYTDENDELIDTDKFVTNEVVKEVISGIDGDDYLWERFNENFTDTCRDIIARLLDEKKEAEQDIDLWDTEGRTNASIKSDSTLTEIK